MKYQGFTTHSASPQIRDGGPRLLESIIPFHGPAPEPAVSGGARVCPFDGIDLSNVEPYLDVGDGSPRPDGRRMGGKEGAAPCSRVQPRPAGAGATQPPAEAAPADIQHSPGSSYVRQLHAGVAERTTTLNNASFCLQDLQRRRTPRQQVHVVVRTEPANEQRERVGR